MTPTEKKDAYRVKQREREASRREALGLSAYTPAPQPNKRRMRETARPVYGSQQWAETYQDDIGETFD